MVNHESRNSLVRMAVRTVLAGGALAATLGMTSVHAKNAPANESQDPAAPAAQGPAVQLQEVVVTGSLIATAPSQVEMSAITTVSPAEIRQGGVTRIEDLLNRLPQITAAQNSGISNGANGTATVDLYDMGAKRTLVLVDGLRMNPGDPGSGGAADLNMIPQALISNVQILTGGASTIYGADAAAGVINFELDHHFQGVKVILNGGIYSQSNTDTQGASSAISAFNSAYNPIYPFKQAPSSFWGGAQKEVTVLAGFNTPDGKGNATFYFSYRNVNAVLQKSYSYSACSLGSGYVAGSYDSGGKFTCIGSSTGYPGRFLQFYTTAAGKSATNDYTIVPSTGTLVPFNPSELYNFGPANYYQRPDERYLAGSLMHYTFNSHATFHAATMFMDDESHAQIAPSGTFFDSFNVNCSNPFLSASERAGFDIISPTTNMVTGTCATDPTGMATVYIGRRNIEGGNRVDNLEHVQFQENLGLSGAINDAWHYNGTLQYGFTDLLENYQNDVSFTKINDAFDVVINPNTGQPECAVTAAGATNGLAAGCVPYNIFGSGGSAYMSPAAATSYINTPGMQRGKIQQWITQLDFTGDLGKYGIRVPTAAAGVQVAIGADYRDDKDSFLPGAEFQSNDLIGQGAAILPIHGDTVVREAFTQVRVPLISNRPFFETLDANVSYRYSGYSKFNGASSAISTNTYAFSVHWKPSHDYAFGGNFARAVRAPNIGELYTAQSVTLDGTQDPCSGPHPAYSAAQCARTGVTAGAYGSVAPNTASQYNGLTGGNPNLQPETVLTTTGKFTWTPSYIPRLMVSLQYYNIKIEGVVQELGSNTILLQCLTNDVYCSQIHRGPGETLWLPGGFVTDTEINAGTIDENGAQVNALYRLHLNRLGDLRFSLIGNFVGSYQIAPVPGVQYNCAGYYGNGCIQTGGGVNGTGGQPLPKYRQNLRATWVTPWHGIDVSAQWRYIAGVKLYALSPNPSLGCLASGCSIANGQVSNTDASLPSFNYLDLSVSGQMQNVPGHMKWIVGVNNVMDVAPPLIGLTNLPGGVGNGNTFPGIYDSLGRYLFAQLSFDF